MKLKDTKNIDTLKDWLKVQFKMLDEIELVKRVCKRYGVEIKKTGCTDCVRDAIVELYGILNKCEEAQRIDGVMLVRDGREIRLRDGVDILVNGKRINNLVATEEDLQMLINLGLTDYLTFTNHAGED